MQDDQKGSQEPDPWAGLDADGDGAQGEGFNFSFDELDAEQTDASSPVEPGEPDDAVAASFGISPESGEAGRLSIFQPAEADAVAEASEEVRPDDDRPAAASKGFSEDHAAALDSWERQESAGDAERRDAPADAFGDDFDAELARELAEDPGQSQAAQPAEAASGGDLDHAETDAADTGFGAGFGAAFGDADHEPAAGPSGGSPFGESDFGESAAAEPIAAAAEGFGGFGTSDANDAGDGTGAAGDSGAGDSGFGSSGFGDLGFGEASREATGAVDGVAGVATAAAITAAAAAESDSPTRPRKKSSGLGQMVGVAAGGLMALPITYAILIWGFQKDPFKLGRQLPPQLAVLLPQKLQPGAKSQAGRGKPAVKEAGASGSLDDLGATDVAVAATDDSGDGQPADPQAEGEMQPDEKNAADANPEDPKSGDEPASDPAAEPGDAPAVVPRPAAAGDLAALLKQEIKDESADEKKDEMKDDPGETAEPAPADDATATAPPSPAPGDLAAALPAIGGLPGLDPGPSAGVPAAAAMAEPPPLDLTRIEETVERAFAALEAIGEQDDQNGRDQDSGDQDDAVEGQGGQDVSSRDRRLVAWYRRLARVGEELVRLETEAADTSRPLDETPASVAGLLERIGGDEVAVADLERLGRMWLTKRAQRASGAAIVATLEESRRVGPYWITHTSVVEVDANEPGRKVTIVSRRPPPAEVGDRVIAAGVMFDDDTVWAAEVWPVGGVATADAIEGEMEDEMEDELAGEMAEETGESPEDASGIRLDDEPVVRGRRARRAPFADLDEPDAGAPAADAPAPDGAEPADDEAPAEEPEMKDGDEGGPEPSEPETTEPETEPSEAKPDPTESEPVEPAAEKPAGAKPDADAAEDDAADVADPAPAPPAVGEADAADEAVDSEAA